MNAPRRAVVCLGLAALLYAQPSKALSCTSATDCLCKGAATAVRAEVVSVDGARSIARVTDVRGGPWQIAGDQLVRGSPTLVVGEEFVLPRQPEDAPGTFKLVLLDAWNSEGGVQAVLPLQADQFTCTGADPDLVLPWEDAAEIAIADHSCPTLLLERGLQEPGCGGPGGPCSTTASGPWLWLAAALLGLQLSARRWRTSAEARGARG